MKSALDHLRAHRDSALADLLDLLRIPSDSGDPAHASDVRRAAGWLTGHLRDAGFSTVRLLETPGHPSVFAEATAATPDAPVLLLYGHYDVQPADPLEEWLRPPYEPQVIDGVIHARGASDDKGQVFALITAVAAYLRGGEPLPVTVKLLVEGEEELSSPNLGDLLATHRDLLACDAIALADQPMLAPGVPLVLYGVRGSIYLQIDVRGPAKDLHSGTFGGAVDNPANVLARILASLQDGETRKVLVPGFYDDVIEIDDDERAHFASLPVNDKLASRLTGAPGCAGEVGYPLVERVATRPTLEVHGMVSGFVGEGKKTVIPATATAKISSRLVPGQEPGDILAKFQRHLRAVTPDTVEVNVTVLGQSRPAVMDRTSVICSAAGQAYERAFGAAPLFMRGGGSEPCVAEFQRHLRAPVCMIGFGLPTDNIHAPNEHLGVEQFHLGAEFGVHLIRAFAQETSR